MSFIKIDKDMVRAQNLNDYDMALKLYLKFSENRFNEINITINSLCADLGYSYQTRNCNTGFPNKFKNWIYDNIGNHNFQLLSDPDITNNKLIRFNMNWQDVDYKYVILNIEELTQIINIARQTKCQYHKLLNLFLLIKSYMCFETCNMHCCIVSYQTFIHSLQCATKTFIELRNILVEAHMLYHYQFSESDNLMGSYGLISTIYSVEPYAIEDIINNFKI